ncbi:MAG: hypothetical protein Q9187_008565 [Circinaria calcarea]
MSKYIKIFTVIPKELFRLNSGASIALRDRSVKRIGSYDLVTESGKVKPKALEPATYRAPNGASMRPNTPTQNRLVKTLQGKESVVYSIPKGTQLPDDLVLVHEFKDHYSLQVATEMTLEGESSPLPTAEPIWLSTIELNSKINNFMCTAGKRLTREEWLQKYPRPTETA